MTVQLLFTTGRHFARIWCFNIQVLYRFILKVSDTLIIGAASDFQHLNFYLNTVHGLKYDFATHRIEKIEFPVYGL